MSLDSYCTEKGYWRKIKSKIHCFDTNCRFWITIDVNNRNSFVSQLGHQLPLPFNFSHGNSFPIQQSHNQNYNNFRSLPSSIFGKQSNSWTFTEYELILIIKDYTFLSLNIAYLIYYTSLCFRNELARSWNK